jgi:hypothetical protein
MSESRNSSYSVGGNTTGLLGVLFVGLKLTGYIQWPWLWVLAPFWIPLAIALAVLTVAGIIYVIAYLVEKH